MEGEINLNIAIKFYRVKMVHTGVGCVCCGGRLEDNAESKLTKN